MPAANVASTIVAPAERSSRDKPAHRYPRWTAPTLAVAAAAAVFAVLLRPGGQTLEASGTNRLAFSPSRPEPGGMLTVRNTPAPWFRNAPRLVLVGRWLGVPRSERSLLSTTGDSIGALMPAAGGVYEARVRLPDNFIGLQLAVGDSSATESDTDGWRTWLVLGGTREGKPSLAALLAASEQVVYMGGLPPSHGPRQWYDISDSLRRYFPGHPAGWAYDRPHSGKGTPLARLIGFFQSGERKYASFYEELWPRRDLDAERMHEMVGLARAISEPAEENRWARRLVREHPEDPRGFDDLVSALHQVELTQPPALADSIRPWLPVMEQAYQRNGRHIPGYEVVQLVSRYGDSATKALWESRLDSASNFHFWQRDFEHNAQSRHSAEGLWMNATREYCGRRAGSFAMIRSPAVNWQFNCEDRRMLAFGFLARAALIDGDYRAARAFADSGEATSQRVPGCGRYYGIPMTGAQASLRLHDIARAEREVIAQFGAWGNNEGTLRDSARAWLGARAESPAFRASIDSARSEQRSCLAREKAASDRRRKLYESVN